MNMETNMMVPIAIAAISAGVLGCAVAAMREARGLVKRLRAEMAKQVETASAIMALEQELAAERRLNALVTAELQERREEIDNLEVELTAAKEALAAADRELDRLAVGRFATSAPRR